MDRTDGRTRVRLGASGTVPWDTAKRALLYLLLKRQQQLASWSRSLLASKTRPPLREHWLGVASTSVATTMSSSASPLHPAAQRPSRQKVGTGSVIDYTRWSRLEFSDSDDDDPAAVGLSEREIVARDANTIDECRADAKKVSGGRGQRLSVWRCTLPITCPFACQEFCPVVVSSTSTGR